MNTWILDTWYTVMVTISKSCLSTNGSFWVKYELQMSHIPLPSQHSCANSAADHHAHLHLPLPSITTLVAAVRLESDHGWERNIEVVFAWVNREDEEDHDDTHEPHSLEARAGEHVWDNLAITVSAPNIYVPALMSTATCKTFKQSKMWNFEASENWAPLTDVVWTETSRTNLTKHILDVFWPFSRCSRWLWGHRGWRDHSNIQLRWGSEGRWSKGASHSWHWIISRMLLWTSPSSLLTAVCRHFRSCKEAQI